MLYYRMQIIICFLVALLGLVIAEKGQRGYSPAHNLRNYGTVEGRGLWLGGGLESCSDYVFINLDSDNIPIPSRLQLTIILTTHFFRMDVTFIVYFI
jgi:hypothetical protein